MPDTFENQSPQVSPSPSPLPPAPVAPPKHGSSALKIVLIILGVFVVLGVLVAGIVGYGIYRVAHAVHKAANGDVSLNLPGGGFSANTTQAVSASDLGVAIYPGATQAKNAVHMSIAGKTIVTANFSTSDSPDQVVAFYKDKLGPSAQTMTTGTGGYINANNGNDSITITVVQQANQNDGKTQFTIVHSSGSSS
jgi:hypothetical protein